MELKAFSTEHYQRLISWVPDERMLVLCAGKDFYFPLDQAQLDTYCQRADLVRYAAFDDNGVHFGHADLVCNAPNARICRVIIDPARRGQGWGKKFILALVKAGLALPGVTEITLNVMGDNTAAIRCYEAAGFEKIVPENHFSFEYSGHFYSGYMMRFKNDRKS